MAKPMTCFQDIPFELIERIIDYLPSQTRAILLRTNQALSRPSLWHNLYHSVLLEEQEQWNSFLHTIQTSSLGQHVRHIILSTSLAQQQETMTELQRWCPNVMAVQLTLEPCSDSSPKYQCDLTRWPRLVSASDDLYSNMDDIIRSTRSHLLHLSTKIPLPISSSSSFITTLPSLTLLDYHVSTLDLETLDYLNQTCPALQTLSLKSLDVPWNDQHDWLTRTSWTANRSLVSLDIEHVYFADPAWYRLFSQLYPNLRSLVLHSLAASSRTAIIRRIYAYLDRHDDDDDDDDNDDDDNHNDNDNENEPLPSRSIHYRHHYTWETTLRAINELMIGLTRLKRLHIYAIGTTPTDNDDKNDDKNWLALFHSLEDVRLDWYCRPYKTYGRVTEKTPEPKWKRLQSLIHACPHVSTWHLFLKHDPIPLQRHTFDTLATTTRLVSLVLHTTYETDITIPIDTILTLLPNLLTLEFWLKFGKDLNSPIEKQAPRLKSLWRAQGTFPPPSHGLTRFVYVGKLTSSRLIAYVNALCPRLAVLHLDARQTPAKKPIRLDLSGRHLDELDLGSTLTFGKIQRSVLVQEKSRCHRFAFSNGRWDRRTPHDLGMSLPTNLTILCDSLRKCVYRPQPHRLPLVVK